MKCAQHLMNATMMHKHTVRHKFPSEDQSDETAMHQDATDEKQHDAQARKCHQVLRKYI